MTSQSVHILMLSHWGLEFQHINSWGDQIIQFITVNLNPKIKRPNNCSGKCFFTTRTFGIILNVLYHGFLYVAGVSSSQRTALLNPGNCECCWYCWSLCEDHGGGREKFLYLKDFILTFFPGASYSPHQFISGLGDISENSQHFINSTSFLSKISQVMKVLLTE